jgi:hypothetical protein
MNMRHFLKSPEALPRRVNPGRLMDGIGNRMEPNRVSIRLFGDVE